jgi:hypothetical protein
MKGGPDTMTEKQKRREQAEKIMNTGIFPGVYCLLVRTFDGRTISRTEYETETELTKAYKKAVREYRQRASVTRYIYFTIE